MKSSLYLEHVNDSAVAWDCLACNCPNYTSFCFSMVFSTTNPFSVLSDTSISSPGSSNQIKPVHTSTPTRALSTPKGVKQQPLRILNVNLQSIKTKQHLLENMIRSTYPDIIFGTETWIDNSIKDSQIFPRGYTIFRNDRNLSGGGVLIAVKNNYIATATPELQTECEIVWCKLELVGHKAIYLCSYYNPRTSNEESINQLGKSLERAASIKYAFLVIAGDFNLPGWDWKGNTLKSNTQYPSIHHKFTEILDDNELTQIVEEPTRGTNILDLIATNHPSSFRRTEIIPGVSDHDIVYTKIDIVPTRQQQKPRQIPLYSKAKWDNVISDVKAIYNEIMNMKNIGESVNSMWTYFQNNLDNSIKNNIPHKTAKNKDGYPWINRDLKRLIRKRDRSYKRKKKSGNKADKNKY